MRNALPTEQINTYLKFDVPDVGTVTSAKLRLYAYDGGDNGGSVYTVANTYRGATTLWTEEGLIWNNAPQVGTTPLNTVGAVGANTWVEFDVTKAIAGKGTYSFAVANTSTNSVFFNSKENAANQPQLILAAGTGTPPATSTAPAPTTTATTPAPTVTAAPSGGQMFAPSEDTMARLAYPTSIYGALDNLRVRSTLPTDRINTYLKFVVPDVGAVTSARIRLWVYDGGDQGGSIYKIASTYRNTTTAWTEEGLNWNNRPETGTTLLNTVGAVSAFTWVEFDVTAAITGKGTYSFAILNTSINSVLFNSKENAANQPQLIINGGTSSPVVAQIAADSIEPAVAAESEVAIAADLPVETPVEIVTDLPAETPVPVVTETEAPSLTPEPPQSLVVVESDNPAVRQDGSWTAHSTELASGGQYMYSSGSADDVLTMQFQGSELKVVFVKHPALGSFGIDIDGVPIQVVDTTAADSVFGAEVIVAGLSPDTHTMRVYPVSGTIALDAFAVAAVVSEPPVVVTEETPEPTETVVPETPLPTDAPTEELTEEPAVEPTAEPTAEPTVVVDVPMVGIEFG